MAPDPYCRYPASCCAQALCGDACCPPSPPSLRLALSLCREEGEGIVRLRREVREPLRAPRQAHVLRRGQRPGLPPRLDMLRHRLLHEWAKLLRELVLQGGRGVLPGPLLPARPRSSLPLLPLLLGPGAL